MGGGRGRAVVEAVAAGAGGRPPPAPPPRQVGQHQVVVGDDDVGTLEVAAGTEEGAGGKMTAAAIGALAMVDGQPPPVAVVDGHRPALAIPFPATAAVGLGHLLHQRLEVIAGALGQTLLEQRQGGVVLDPVEGLLQARQAEVATAPLGQGVVEVEAAVGLEGGQILQQHLLLQGDGGRSHHQTLALGLGHRQRRQQVGQGLAGAGTRL